MESADRLWDNIPQDIWTQIFKYLPIAPERWNCLFVSKGFYRAMQSPLLWSHITFQNCSVMPKRRSWDELERKVNKPKKAELSAPAFLGYLKKNHREVVVELDLSFAALESEGDYLPRKFNVSYSPEYNEDHMNVFWSLMFDFPNLRNLSVYNSFFNGGSTVTFGLPTNKNLRSSVRNLNLIKQQLFYPSRESLQTILDYAPDLEVLQAGDISEADIELEKEYPKLKQLLLIYCTISPTNVMAKCPNLEVFVNFKYNNNWGMPAEETSTPASNGKILFITGERKPFREVTLEEATTNAKAIQNVRYATAAGVPLLSDLINFEHRDHLEFCLQTLKLDPNIRFRANPDISLDPFVLMYPYDADSENRDWGDNNTEISPPDLLYNGDAPLHYAVKKRRTAMVKLLLESGADPNAQNSNYQTPICFAHNMEMLKVLLQHGASRDVIDKNGWNVLMNFVANKTRLYDPATQEVEDHISFNDASVVTDGESRLKAFKHLVELGCDVNYQAPNGLNVLKVALSAGDETIVDYLLENVKTLSPEKSPCIGVLCSVAAMRSPKADLIDRLLQLGADPTVVDETGQTYLHVAAERGRTNLLTSVELVEDKAKLLTLLDASGYTCLHYAALPQNMEVIWDADAQQDYLKHLEKKINKGAVQHNLDNANTDLNQFFSIVAEAGVIDVQASSGETPLLLACRSFTAERKREAARRLLENKANPNIVDHDGGSPLIAAAYALDSELVELLLQHGADVTHCDKMGVNALLAAAFAIVKRCNELKVHNYQHGYRVNEKKSLKESDKKGFNKIFEILLKNKVNVNQQERLSGHTVLHIFASLSESVVSEWLTTLVKEHGADINARSWINEAPLHYAIKQRNVTAAKTLMQLGADVNAPGFGNLTPLQYILEINQSLHSLSSYSMSDDLAICVDGYKIVAKSLVRYPSWQWSSIDDHSQNPTLSYYEADSDVGVELFAELFRLAADKLNFNSQSFIGNLALHGCWSLAKNITDPTNIAQGLIDPKHFLLVVPLLMLKYATREQLLTKNFAESTPFETMLTSNMTALKPNSMSGVYPGVKEATDLVFKRCVELVGDTIDINHVLIVTSMQCEYKVIELLVSKAKENGKLNLSNIKTNNNGLLSQMLSNVLTDPRLYTLLNDTFRPLWSKPLDRVPPLPVHDPALFNFISSYSSACGYEDKVSRPKMLNDLMKAEGIDWNSVVPSTKENLLHATLLWFRNVSGRGLLYNQIWPHKNVIEAEKILSDLIKVGVNPHHKNSVGQSFAELMPQYEKILRNEKILMGEEKRAIQKENYFVNKKPSLLQELLEAISYNKA